MKELLKGDEKLTFTRANHPNTYRDDGPFPSRRNLPASSSFFNNRYALI